MPRIGSASTRKSSQGQKRGRTQKKINTERGKIQGKTKTVKEKGIIIANEYGKDTEKLKFNRGLLGGGGDADSVSLKPE